MKKRIPTKMTVVKGGKTKTKPEADDSMYLAVISTYKKQTLPISKKISSLTIESEHDYAMAEQLLDQLKLKLKAVVKERQSFTGPLRKIAIRIEKLFKPYTTSLELIEKDTKAKMIEYRKEVQSEVKQLTKKFENGKIGHTNFLNKVSKLESSIVGSHTIVRNVKVVEIYNENIIPREYLVPDKAKIEVALKEGTKVPGCKFVNQENISV